MLGATAAIWPYRMPMSRLARSFWLGSSTSPLAMTSSYLSAGSAGSKPRGAGAPPACASCSGVCACAGAAAPAAAAVLETMKSRRERSMTASLLAQLGAVVGDDVEERADRGGEDVHVGGDEAARRGLAGHGLGADGHHADGADVAGGVGTVRLGIQQ